MIKLIISGVPQSKQSARFMIAGKDTDKPFIRSYQKKSVVDRQVNISWSIKKQLPKEFELLENELFVDVTFIFPILKNMNKKLREEIESGRVVYKTTKPDLIDNLMKGLFDSMNGIVFKDDAQICTVSSRKIFGKTPQTIVEIGEIKI